MADLAKKMVFLVGPRQVGKTWLAQDIARDFPRAVYLNYDDPDDRTIIQKRAWLPETDLLVLDELHKMRRWKAFLKGTFDTRPRGLQILVTGSARLDTFERAGDSLAGRFFRHRLLPLSLSELAEPTRASMQRLIERGGFPEPFLAEDRRDAERWRLLYTDGLVRHDVLDFERIHDLRALELLVDMLRRRVGSPVSFSSLARDLQLAPNTVKRYVQILEALFIVFRVIPYSRNIARSLLKEPKLYFYDSGMVLGDDGARFENFVAVSLLKHVHALEDVEGERAELRYLRTKDGEEIDFCVVRGQRLSAVYEAKVSEAQVDPSLAKFHAKYALPAMQIVRDLRNERIDRDVPVRRALSVLASLKP